MIINIVLLSIALVALIIGTITDIKTREVPDWLNYSVIFAAVGIRAIYSAFTFDWMFLISGLIGLGIFVAIAYAMFYTGQWGGGDSKLLMGLGALIGFQIPLQPASLSIVFLINLAVFGAVYGMIFMFALAVKHRKEFWHDFYKRIHSPEIEKIRPIILGSAIVLLVLDLILVKPLIIKLLVFLLIAFAYILFYLFLFAKSVEEVAMYKHIPPEKLTEGDWIAKEIRIRGKHIAGPKDLGISRKQIRQLIALKRKGKIRKIKVKYGIPFVPSFLIAFVMTVLLGAWWMLFI